MEFFHVNRYLDPMEQLIAYIGPRYLLVGSTFSDAEYLYVCRYDVQFRILGERSSQRRTASLYDL
jgi:hypothetical protein